MSKTALLTALFIFLANPLSAALYKQDNFESNSVTTHWTVYAGTPTISSTANHGLYSCLLVYSDAASQALRTDYSLNKSETYDRIYARFHVTANPAAQRTIIIHAWGRSGGLGIASIRLIVATNGALSLRLYNEITSAQVGSDYGISDDTWYLLEYKLVVSATVGVLEVKVDGTSRISGTGLNTGTDNLDMTQIKVAAAGTLGLTVYYDDIRFDDAAYPGPYVAPFPAIFSINRRRQF